MTSLLERVREQAGEPVSRHRRRLIVAAVLVLVLFFGWLIGFSSVFGVRSVQVSGEKTLSSADILATAAVRNGSPLARLDLAAIRDRVAAIPQVGTVTVSKSYPSSVRIRITERVAVGYRATPEGAALVDAGNVQFRTDKKAPAGLPKLELTADQARSTAEATVAAALPATVTRKVATITAPTPESVTLTLTDKRTVLWGGTDRDDDKARLLPVLLTQPGNYFDLSDPSSVISRGATGQ